MRTSNLRSCQLTEERSVPCPPRKIRVQGLPAGGTKVSQVSLAPFLQLSLPEPAFVTLKVQDVEMVVVMVENLCS